MKDKKGVDLKLAAKGDEKPDPKKLNKPGLKMYVGFNKVPKCN